MTAIASWLSTHVRAGNTARAQRYRREGSWVSRTYGELYDEVRRAAAVLDATGAGPEAPVMIVAQTSPEWTVFDLAAAMIGAPSVPVYPTSSVHQVAELLARTRPAVIVTDRDDLPPTSAVVMRLAENDVDAALAASTPLTAQQSEALEGRAAAVPADRTFSIVFSSGSTGAPKGCILTHANWIAVVSAAAAFEAAGPEGAEHRAHAFVYLPLAHVSARLQQFSTLALGGELVYGSGATPNLLEQIRQSRPTYVPGVPRLFESAYHRVGGDPQRLREVFGTRLKYALTGGAPIDAAILDAYARAGVPLVEGYGLTESSAALTLCAPHAQRPGSVGRALPGVELRIADDGEVLARGANIFVGYLDDPEATRDAFVDGWLRTGDLGSLDDDGFLWITGRKKNLLVTSTGKNIAPEPTENRMRIVLGVPDVLLVGDGRPYLSAIVFGRHPDDDALLDGLHEVNSRLSPPERVRRVLLVPRALRADDGELTAGGKIVRRVVLDNHAQLVDDLYSGVPVVGARVLEVDAASASRAPA
ncbi:long-chain fatty acid--CoA ligase [Microbacterium sp. Ru50]|uniref:AMP-dependent synthetase/ligase n=1 Tax=Microbacterium sp. Ru50 TaxID=2080744 RepID=UPI000CDE1676|nr:AMP-binding protein [Microbacterium sp. Ru50]POX65913.1 long-chain fatty acid--CoA ligase [Microbacterium sp. Ru50]